SRRARTVPKRVASLSRAEPTHFEFCQTGVAPGGQGSPADARIASGSANGRRTGDMTNPTDDPAATVSDGRHPPLGFGLGLRTDHYIEIDRDRPRTVDWFEILSENYMVPGGRPLHWLDRIRAHYPVAMHGVSLSIGSTDP